MLDTTPLNSDPAASQTPPISSIPPDEAGLREVESLDVVKARIASTNDVHAEDLRFALLSEESYKTAVEPQTGPAFIYAQGVTDVAESSDDPLFSSLGHVLGFSREWSSAKYHIKQEVWYLSSDKNASALKARIVSGFASAGAADTGPTKPSVVFSTQVRQDDPETKSPVCSSYALATSARIVALTRVSSPCGTSTLIWAEILASNTVSEALALGL